MAVIVCASVGTGSAGRTLYSFAPALVDAWPDVVLRIDCAASSLPSLSQGVASGVDEAGHPRRAMRIATADDLGQLGGWSGLADKLPRAQVAGQSADAIVDVGDIDAPYVPIPVLSTADLLVLTADSDIDVTHDVTWVRHAVSADVPAVALVQVDRSNAHQRRVRGVSGLEVIASLPIPPQEWPWVLRRAARTEWEHAVDQTAHRLHRSAHQGPRTPTRTPSMSATGAAQEAPHRFEASGETGKRPTPSTRRTRPASPKQGGAHPWGAGTSGSAGPEPRASSGTAATSAPSPGQGWTPHERGASGSETADATPSGTFPTTGPADAIPPGTASRAPSGGAVSDNSTTAPPDTRQARPPDDADPTAPAGHHLSEAHPTAPTAATSPGQASDDLLTGAGFTTSAGDSNVPSAPSMVPYVRLLGPIQVDDAAGDPGLDHSRAQAVVAYLALHRDASLEQLSDALWPTERPHRETVEHALTEVRCWLGHSSSGEPYCAAAGPRPLLHPSVRSDWDDFCELVRSEVDDPVERLRRLDLALALVRGLPLDGGADEWAKPLRASMVERVTATAAEATERHLELQDTPAARRAVAVGRLADAADETLWRALLRVEHACKRRTYLVRTYETYLQQHRHLDTTPDPATTALYEQLMTESHEQTTTPDAAEDRTDR